MDESPLYAESWRAVLACRYGPAVSFEAYQDPIAALEAPHAGRALGAELPDLRTSVRAFDQKGVS